MKSMRKCLISAGPTREFIDPVRFLSNPSTGKMGYAMAEAARDAGWETILVSGPVALSSPAGVEVISVVSAEEMQTVLQNFFPACDLLIMSAAVGDFRPAKVHDQKLKRGKEGLTLQLEAVPDILAGLAATRRAGQQLVGFAAETENLEEYAKRKLAQKGIDWIVGNQVNLPNQGFGSDQNRVEVFSRWGDHYSYGPASKREIARQLFALWGTPSSGL